MAFPNQKVQRWYTCPYCGRLVREEDDCECIPEIERLAAARAGMSVDEYRQFDRQRQEQAKDAMELKNSFNGEHRLGGIIAIILVIVMLLALCSIVVFLKQPASSTLDDAAAAVQTPPAETNVKPIEAPKADKSDDNLEDGLDALWEEYGGGTPPPYDFSGNFSPSPSPLQEVQVSNGEIIIDPFSKKVAPLEVSTKGTDNYYIVLDGTTKMSFYVCGGRTVEVLVPLGDYEIYYAVGKTWYGKDCLFGTDTKYYKCEGIFDFTDDGQYYNGWTLELYLQTNGNMDTEFISAANFPS